jgi:hypothetical protein
LLLWQACLLDESPPVAMLLPKGSGVLYDPAVFHCGGANDSEQLRSLLSVSFRHPWHDAAPGERGSTDSLLPEYRDAFRAADFME